MEQGGWAGQLHWELTGFGKVVTLKKVLLCPIRCVSHLNLNQALTKSCGSLCWTRTHHTLLHRGCENSEDGDMTVQYRVIAVISATYICVNAIISATYFKIEYLLISDIVHSIVSLILGL